MKQMKINVAGQESVFDYNKIAHNTQEELVSGENLKTVNQNTLLGSGDVPIEVEGGIIVEAAANKTVNGLIVPDLSDDQLHAIYNATVAGKSVTITDATGMMHFTGVTTDTVSDEVFVSFVYFDKMVLEYGEGGATTFKEVGGSKVSANPTLSGSETALTGLDIDGIKYAAKGSKYKYAHILATSYTNNMKLVEYGIIVRLNNSASPLSPDKSFNETEELFHSYMLFGNGGSSNSPIEVNVANASTSKAFYDTTRGSIAFFCTKLSITVDSAGAITGVTAGSGSQKLISWSNFQQRTIEL